MLFGTKIASPTLQKLDLSVYGLLFFTITLIRLQICDMYRWKHIMRHNWFISRSNVPCSFVWTPARKFSWGIFLPLIICYKELGVSRHKIFCSLVCTNGLVPSQVKLVSVDKKWNLAIGWSIIDGTDVKSNNFISHCVGPKYLLEKNYEGWDTRPPCNFSYIFIK